MCFQTMTHDTCHADFTQTLHSLSSRHADSAIPAPRNESGFAKATADKPSPTRHTTKTRFARPTRKSQEKTLKVLEHTTTTPSGLRYVQLSKERFCVN